MTLLEKFLRFVVQIKASDLYIVPGEPPIFRVDGQMTWSSGETPLNRNSVLESLQEIVTDPRVWDEFDELGHAEFTFDFTGLGRFRGHLLEDQRGLGASFRVIPNETPSLDQLKLPTTIKKLLRWSRGLILVSGPPGSGRSTTMAAMLKDVCEAESVYLTTFENPVEFRLKSEKSVVSQFTIKSHEELQNYSRSATQSGVDTMSLGEIRDFQQLEVALNLVEQGFRVFAVVGGVDCIATIRQLIALAPVEQQGNLRQRLTRALGFVTNQRLLRGAEPETAQKTRDTARFKADFEQDEDSVPKALGLFPAVEIMVATEPARACIYEDRMNDLRQLIRRSGRVGMIDLDSAILRWTKSRQVNPQDAYLQAQDKSRVIEAFRRDGLAFVAPRYADQRAAQKSLRKRMDVVLERESEREMLAKALNQSAFVDDSGDAMTMFTLDDVATITMRDAVDDESLDSIQLLGKNAANTEAKTLLSKIEPAPLEIGRVNNAHLRGRLLMTGPDKSESVVEIFGGTGILFGRARHDLQRSLRNDWICSALAAAFQKFEDDNFDAEARAREKTRQIGKVHGGLRVVDNGSWQIANWSRSGLEVNDFIVETESWFTLPKGRFDLNIANGAVQLDCRAIRSHALCLTRQEIDISYLVLRKSALFATNGESMTCNPVDLGELQSCFELRYDKRVLSLVPSSDAQLVSDGRSIEERVILKSGFEFYVRGFKVTFQALTPIDASR